MSKLVPTIGMEIHCELKTKQKIFSNSLNIYGEEANSQINEIDLGYPGTLPKLNKEVIDLGIKAALLLNCTINQETYFDRKNYFYPDLSKGYQISQINKPIGINGYVNIEINNKIKKIEIEEMHLEEDTAKSMYDNDYAYLDFNRAGVPLLEIVTKPVIENEEEAVIFLEKLREILLYGDISDVKIEEGSMRCDLNISMKEKDSDILGKRVEVKNISSINSVKESVLYEIERQTKDINNNKDILNETRKYDESKKQTIVLRTKETEYTTFIEPNLPIIEISDEEILKIKQTIRLLPDELRKKYKELKLNDVLINALINNRELNDFYLSLEEIDPIISANIICSDLLSYLNKENLKLSETKLNKGNFKKLIKKIQTNEITSKIAKELLSIILIDDKDIDNIKVDVINNEEELKKIIYKIIDNLKEEQNTDKVIRYIIGQVMKETSGKADPIVCKEIIEKTLKIK